MALITTSIDNVMAWHHDIDVFETAISHVNWNTIGVSTSLVNNGNMQSTGAQNAERNFDVPLAAGTWVLELLHNRESVHGVYSIQVEGVEVGTIDGYGSALNVRDITPPFVVTISGKKRLTLKMATKNPSSTGYYGAISHIQLRRTDAGGAGQLVQVNPDTQMPWVIDINPFMTPISHVNWNANTTDGTSAYNAWNQSTGAQNAEKCFDVVLAAGTWTVETHSLTGTDHGIMSVRFDGVEKGTIDHYASGGSAARNQQRQVTGIVVAATAKIRLSFKMATKNASSASYYGHLQHVQLRRTL